MKKIIVELYKVPIRTFVDEEDKLEVSDGYHSMTDLYEHKYALFCALCKVYDNYITPFNTRVKCWKSLHSSEYFIAGMTIGQFDGTVKYVTYRLPITWWDKFKICELKTAPQYDSHTSIDVIRVLGEL